MATRAETTVIYATGAVQGVVLVTFPAASTIFTNPDEYDLSTTRYGTMFLPQVVTAVTAALLCARLARRFGTKRVYLVGLVASLTSMVLLIASQPVAHQRSLAYGLLLAATAFLGAGFGLTVPAINTFTAAFHPRAVDTSVLILNALLGLGTTLAPVFVALFVGLGVWQGLPVTSAVGLAVLLVLSHRLPLHAGTPTGATAAPGGRVGDPHRCSALLPLTISFGQEELPTFAAAMSGGVIAFYQVGYGIAAFGVGPLRASGVALPTIFGAASAVAVAVAMGLLSFAVARRRPGPASLHPRPEPAVAPAATPVRGPQPVAR